MQGNEIIDKRLNLKFGEYVRQRREELDLTQIEFCELANITQAYLSYLERGERMTIDLPVAVRICNVLGLKVDDFVENYKNNI